MEKEITRINTKPVISVIVPVYNAELYIEKCIMSLLSQKIQNIEVIAVDDGSIDSSLLLLNRMANSDQRLRVFHQTNLGVSAARNYGLREARGEYIGFCDADDWTEDCMFDLMYHKAKEFNADIVFCGIYKNNDQADVPYIHDGFYSRSEIEQSIFPILICNIDEINDGRTLSGSVCSKLFSTKLIREHGLEFDSSMSSYEDYLFCIWATFYANTYYYMGTKHLYHVRRNVVSSTKRYMNNYWNRHKNIPENLHALETEAFLMSVFKPQIDKFLFIIAVNAIINEAKRMSLKSIKQMVLELRSILNDQLLQNNISEIDSKLLNRTNKGYLLAIKYKNVPLSVILGRRSWKKIKSELKQK